jgi:hypothetical protein
VVVYDWGEVGYYFFMKVIDVPMRSVALALGQEVSR